jgi:hypothetical protein
MKKTVIGIDPGNLESALCVYDGEKVLWNGIHPNKEFLSMLEGVHGDHVFENGTDVPIYLEDIQAMGMAVGQEIFDTAKMIGRIQLFLEQKEIPYKMVKRTEIKLHHCGSTRAKDANITLALVDRFDPSRVFGKYGKGTVKNQGFFYGFKDDMWSAFAIALYGHDKENLK